MSSYMYCKKLYKTHILVISPKISNNSQIVQKNNIFLNIQ